MKQFYILGAAMLLMGAFAPQTAHADPSGTKQFKKNMQHASQARLNSNGSNILRFKANQDTTMNKTIVAGSVLRTNSLDVDDSLISTLDVKQTANLRYTVIKNSSVNLNDVDLHRARSQHTDIDQSAKLRNVIAYDAGISANTISIR